VSNSKILSGRDPGWVKEARIVGDNGEITFADRLIEALPSHYMVVKPKKLVVYGNGGGIKPDLLVINTSNNKRLYVEKKTGNNKGNAHERAYKYLSKPLQETVSERYNAIDNPFLLIFSGKTFQPESYQSELETNLRDQPYFIMKPGFTNIAEVSYKIQELLA
jgi:hypothetical protein